MVKEKSNGSDSDSSGEEHGTVRKHRGSVTQRPSVFQIREQDEDSKEENYATEKHELFNRVEEDLDVRRAMVGRMIGSALVIVVIILLVVVIYLVTKPVTMPYCDYRDDDYVTPRDLNNPDIFDDLTPTEFRAVRRYLLGIKELNLKKGSEVTVNSSYIFMIQLVLPGKAGVLEYLDRDGLKPIRMAKAIIVRGDVSKPTVQEYLVYPLPDPNTAEEYRDPAFRRYPIPYTSRPVDIIDYETIFATVIHKATEQMYPLLIASYGLCYHNCTEGKNCMEVFDVAPRAYKSGERRSWFWFFSAVDGFYIHPLGLEMLVNHESTNPVRWTVQKVVYNGQPFDSVEALMNEFHANKLKIIHEHDHRENPPYSGYKRRESFPANPKQGPVFHEPEGKRFKVNGQKVRYNKWEFNFHMNPFIGLQIFNAMFDNTRIVYELSPQEVLVFYSGYGPTQSITNYYDSGWMIGFDCMELVRGVDCPETAVFIDTHSMGITSKNSICIFENNGAVPMRRHYANDFEGGYDFYGGINDYHIVVRTVANIWNYDYVFDYIFYNNGAIEVKASATGYVQATFSLQEEKDYGNFINDHVMADLHLHIFNYKVDLDIEGQNNRYSTVNLDLAQFKDPWGLGKVRQNVKMTRKLHTHESKTPTFDSNKLQYHLIHNSNSKNKYGADKSYRILNKAPVLNIMSDLEVANAAKWSKYPIIVTHRKDTERQSSSAYAQNDPWDPVLDFETFIDDESLVDQDLVAWVTMGTHHIPGTEDVPSTPTTWNQYSFFLTPHNYFDEDPSRDSTDTVIIRPGKDNKANIETFGSSHKPDCIPIIKGPTDFDGFRRR